MSDHHNFYIISQLNNKVVDLRGSDPKPGEPVILWPRNCPPTINQRWYLDHKGYICSALNDYYLDTAGNDHIFRATPEDGSKAQKWTIKDHKICNAESGEWMEASEDENDSTLRATTMFGAKRNQLWTIEYISG